MRFYNVFSGFLTGATREAYVRNIGDRVFNSLHSYWYLQNATDEKILNGFAITKGNIMIDSGAFTAYADAKMKRQKADSEKVKPALNIDEYIEKYLHWINKWDSYVTVFGQMDVIPTEATTAKEFDECCQRTWQNYLYMTSRMNSPKKLLYTFHYGEDLKWLKQALEYKFPDGSHMEYIAIGGLVGKSTKDRTSFLDECFKVIKASPVPNVKVHGFGVSSEKMWRRYPFESCDSFTPGMNANHGFTYNERGAYREDDYKRIFKPEEPKIDDSLLKSDNPIPVDPNYIPESEKSEEQLTQEALYRTDEKVKILISNIEHWTNLGNSIPKTTYSFKPNLLG